MAIDDNPLTIHKIFHRTIRILFSIFIYRIWDLFSPLWGLVRDSNPSHRMLWPVSRHFEGPFSTWNDRIHTNAPLFKGKKYFWGKSVVFEIHTRQAALRAWETKRFAYRRLFDKSETDALCGMQVLKFSALGWNSTKCIH